MTKRDKEPFDRKFLRWVTILERVVRILVSILMC